MKHLSQEEKVQIYIDKTIELQRLWKNPIPKREEFDFSDATEEWLDKEIAKTVSLIRYEKRNDFIAKFISIGVTIFIALGVIGLLLFGIKQILGLF
jgi:hypothetical protein